MMSDKSRGRRGADARGIILFDAMAMIMLLGAFALVSARLITFTLRVSEESGRTEFERRRYDAAIDLMRADVWGAREARVEGAADGGGPAVTLALPDGRTVTWKVEGDASLSRIPAGGEGGGGEPQRVAGIGKDLTFSWDGGGLLVRTGPGPAGAVRLTSRLIPDNAEGL